MLLLTDLAPDTTIDPDGLEAAHRTLLAAMADERRAPTPPVRRPRHRVRWVVVATGAAAVTVVALAVPGPSDSPAFAGWTAVPAARASSPDELAADGDECVQSVPGDTADLTVATPVLTDRRGPNTLTLVGTPDGLLACLVGPGVRSYVIAGPYATVGVAGAEHLDTGSLVTVGDGLVAAEPGTVTLAASIIGIFGAPASWGVVAGHAGAGVDGVTVALVDGTTLEATVADGSYAAWWPSRAALASLTPHLVDGTTGPVYDAPRIMPDTGEALEEAIRSPDAVGVG